jgi:hypothetical protein
MKILKLDLRTLRNDEHFQFHTEFRDLINQTTSAALNITAQFTAYQSLFAQEDEALKKIMKSALTEDIEEADRRRDRIFRGIIDANKSALKHFNAGTQAAAKRLKVLFDTYGNVAAKPINEETSAIHNLLQELNGNYAADAATTGITDWATELETANNALDSLVKNRYDESAQRTTLVMKETRTQTDAACRIITDRIDALMLIEGTPVYSGFITQINVIIEKYRNILAQREGRNHAKDKGNEDSSTGTV